MCDRPPLAVIDARAAAATEGSPRWYAVENDLIGGYAVMRADVRPSQVPFNGCYEIADFVSPADAEFIASARTDIPAMSAYIKHLEATLTSHGLMQPSAEPAALEI